MKCNGTDVTDGKMIFSILNEHFCTVGTKMASMQSKTGNPMSSLKKKSTAELTLNPITEIEISKIVEKLPNKTSTGHDGVSNVLVKKLFYTIRYPLCIISNKSFIEGIYPDQFKLAKVIPLHKGGEKDYVDNYRPIFLLPVMPKILKN